MKDLIVNYTDKDIDNKIKLKIDRYGCCLIRGVYKDVSKLKRIHNSYFDDYESSSFVDTPTRNQTEFETKYHKPNGVRIDGCPLEHRLMRGQGPLNLGDASKKLFGKRASVPWEKIGIDADQAFITADLRTCIQSALGAKDDQISFMLGSFNRVFPRYTGESGVLHIDTFGFTNDSNALTEENCGPVPFLNAIVYLTEVNEEISGTRFVRGSHKQYKFINQIVSKALKKDSASNNIHQREIYDELLSGSEGLNEIEQVTAIPGDLFIFSSSLVHGIPGNQSFDKIRDVAIFNFGAVNSSFGKVFHQKEKRKLQKRVEKVGLALSSNQLKYVSKGVSVTKNNLRQYARNISKQLDKIKPSTYSSNSKKLLNIGAGDYFKLSGWERLDYDGDVIEDGIRIKRLKDINFDLSKKVSIPLNDESFDGIYSSHTFEHLKKEVSVFNLKECFRILKPGGVLRLCLPDITKYFDAYDCRDLSFFNWIRDKNIYYYDSWLRMIVREMAGTVVDEFTDLELKSLYKSLGRKKFIRYFEQKTSEDKRVLPALPDIHKSAWGEAETSDILNQIGFKSVRICPYTESRFKPFNGKWGGQINSTRPHLSFAIEGEK